MAVVEEVVEVSKAKGKAKGSKGKGGKGATAPNGASSVSSGIRLENVSTLEYSHHTEHDP